MQQQASAMEEIRNNQLIPGVRFCPMDDELLLFYLKPMLSGQNVRGRNSVIFDCDLYGQLEPWEIWEDYKTRTRRPHDLRLHKDLYFFTQHKKMSSTGKRIRRNVGSGTWKGNDSASGTPVKSLETGRVIGSKKRFTYENKKSEHNGCWTLHEFYLHRSLRDKKDKVKDYVLCLLRKNGESKTKIEKKRKQREEEDVLEDDDACDGGEQSNTEQEELLETQAKRQRTGSAPPVVVPTPSEVDAFVADLENLLPNVEDDNTPSSEADANGFQGVEDGGLQKLVCEVQSAGPSFVPLPEDDFLMNEDFFEGIPNYVPMPSEVDAFIAELDQSLPCVEDYNSPSSEDAFVAEHKESLECVQDDNSPQSEAEAIGFQGVGNGGLQQLAYEVQSGPSFISPPEDDFVMNEEFFEGICNYGETEEEDPAGSDNLCEGLMDIGDGDGLDWIKSINFSPEENFFSSEMLSSFGIGQRQEE